MGARIIICGDVEGRFHKFRSVLCQTRDKYGAFDFVVTVGRFFGHDYTVNEKNNWQSLVKKDDYLSGRSAFPFPVFVLDSTGLTTADEQQQQQGGELNLGSALRNELFLTTGSCDPYQLNSNLTILPPHGICRAHEFVLVAAVAPDQDTRCWSRWHSPDGCASKWLASCNTEQADILLTCGASGDWNSISDLQDDSSSRSSSWRSYIDGCIEKFEPRHVICSGGSRSFLTGVYSSSYKAARSVALYRLSSLPKYFESGFMQKEHKFAHALKLLSRTTARGGGLAVQNITPTTIVKVQEDSKEQGTVCVTKQQQQSPSVKSESQTPVPVSDNNNSCVPVTTDISSSSSSVNYYRTTTTNSSSSVSIDTLSRSSKRFKSNDEESRPTEEVQPSACADLRSSSPPALMISHTTDTSVVDPFAHSSDDLSSKVFEKRRPSTNSPATYHGPGGGDSYSIATKSEDFATKAVADSTIERVFTADKSNARRPATRPQQSPGDDSNNDSDITTRNSDSILSQQPPQQPVRQEQHMTYPLTTPSPATWGPTATTTSTGGTPMVVGDSTPGGGGGPTKQQQQVPLTPTVPSSPTSLANRQVPPRPNFRTLFIPNLPSDSSIRSVFECFEQFGEIEEIRVARNPHFAQNGAYSRTWITCRSPSTTYASCRQSSSTGIYLNNVRLKVMVANGHHQPMDNQIQQASPMLNSPTGWTSTVPSNKVINNSNVLYFNGGSPSAIDIRPHDDCWFCLPNTQCEQSLILSVASQVYLSFSKGALVPSHMLLVPKTHYPNYLLAPESVHIETDLYLSTIHSFFKHEQLETVIFERYVPMRISKAMHTQLNIIPFKQESVGVLVAHIIQCLNFDENVVYSEGFERFANEGGMGMSSPNGTPPPGPSTPSIMPLSRLKSGEFSECCHTGKLDTAYLYFDLPSMVEGGPRQRLVLHSGGKFRLTMNFGREVLAEVLEIPERADWKRCATSPEEEANSAKQLRLRFAPWDEKLQHVLKASANSSSSSMPPNSNNNNNVTQSQISKAKYSVMFPSGTTDTTRLPVGGGGLCPNNSNAVVVNQLLLSGSNNRNTSQQQLSA